MSENSTLSKMMANGTFTDMFLFIKKPKKLLDLEIENGAQADVNCFSISRSKNKIIKGMLGIDTNRKIIRKQFQDGSLSKEDSMQKEIESLLLLYREPCFPTLLSVGQQSLYLSYCGVPLTKHNLPKSWKPQLLKITNILEEKKIFHNDVYIDNFLVQFKTIYLVDFGHATIDSESYPYKNIKTDYIDQHNSFEEVMRAISQNPENIQRRKIFENAL